MNQNFKQMLLNNPKIYTNSHDLNIALADVSTDARQGLIKRALKKKEMIQIKKGFYLIGPPYNKKMPNLFEIAQQLYGSSYISLESALSFHGWIPEAVYTVTSVSPKREKQFTTPLGNFHYFHAPIKNFFIGVDRINDDNEIYLMASGWKALGDCVYVYRKSWQTMDDIMQDLRIEEENLRAIDVKQLETLAQLYPSKRVRNFYLNMLKELSE